MKISINLSDEAITNISNCKNRSKRIDDIIRDYAFVYKNAKKELAPIFDVGEIKYLCKCFDCGIELKASSNYKKELLKELEYIVYIEKNKNKVASVVKDKVSKLSMLHCKVLIDGINTYWKDTRVVLDDAALLEIFS